MISRSQLWPRSTFSRRFGLVLVLLLSLANLGLSPVAAQAPDYEAGEILVKFHPGAPGQAVADAHRQNGGQVQHTIPGIDVQIVKVPVGQEVARVAAYARNPNVEFAELNGYYYATWTPNDSNVGQQWQYNNTGQTGGTAGADMRAFDAWNITTGNSGVVVAILDTGIDQSHPDLAAKIKLNKNFSSSKGYDDKYGHGTHVAGSAAAITNNASGVAGSCPNCVLLNGKVLNDRGSGTYAGIAEGVTWATDSGANVVNMSLGGPSSSAALELAVNYAWERGVVVVASAGNDGVSTPSYPAYYGNVIAVAATDAKDAKAGWSNYGSWVDVAAPGVAILSTAPDHKTTIWPRPQSYASLSGTSMASPHVAGLAGLIVSSGRCGAKDNACVRTRIEDRADKVLGPDHSFGRINAYSSVQP